MYYIFKAADIVICIKSVCIFKYIFKFSANFVSLINFTTPVSWSSLFSFMEQNEQYNLEISWRVTIV